MSPKCNIFSLRLRIIRCIGCRCRLSKLGYMTFSIMFFGAMFVLLKTTVIHTFSSTRYVWSMAATSSGVDLDINDYIGNVSCGTYDGSDITYTYRKSLKRSQHVEGAPPVNFKCILGVLQDQLKYCKNAMRSLIPENTTVPGNKSACSILCPCIPYNLYGRIAPSLDLERKINTTGIQPGGRWRPSHCLSRSRIALIIPFANRHQHLKVFIKHIIPFLQRQLIDFQIFVVEESDFIIFNKAQLMNAGYQEVIKRGNFDCFIFHDVDLLPIDDRHFYSCSGANEDTIVINKHKWIIGPAHLGSYIDKFNFSVGYNALFGGATAFTKAQFENVNGYGLEFWGWGGEDDDMGQRLLYKNYTYTRRAQCVAIYRAIKHPEDEINPKGKNRKLGPRFRPNAYDHGGLRQTNYTVLSIAIEELYTHIYITLPPPPEEYFNATEVPEMEHPTQAPIKKIKKPKVPVLKKKIIKKGS